MEVSVQVELLSGDWAIWVVSLNINMENGRYYPLDFLLKPIYFRSNCCHYLLTCIAQNQVFTDAQSFQTMTRKVAYLTYTALQQSQLCRTEYFQQMLTITGHYPIQSTTVRIFSSLQELQKAFQQKAHCSQHIYPCLSCDEHVKWHALHSVDRLVLER